MRILTHSYIRRTSAALLLIGGLTGLSACSLRSAVLSSQSPETTAEATVTVDAATPTPTVDASSELETDVPTSVVVLSPTPVPTPALTAVVTKNANVRSLPVIKGSKVLGQADSGATVTLRMHNPGKTWYVVQTPSGLIGWVSGILLKIDPGVADQVPEGTSDPGIAK